MATTIQVAGPTKVMWNSTLLGYSDNDNLPSITFTDNLHEVKTVVSGAVPEEIVVTGTSARISLALVKWDEAVLANLLKEQRAAYNNATVGRLLASGSHIKALRVGNIADTNYYNFPTVYLQSDSVVDSQWGNRERVLTLNFMAIPQVTTAGDPPVTTYKLFDYVNAGFTPP